MYVYILYLNLKPQKFEMCIYETKIKNIFSYKYFDVFTKYLYVYIYIYIYTSNIGKECLGEKVSHLIEKQSCEQARNQQIRS